MANTHPDAAAPDWTLSIVSHGHMANVRRLLADLARHLEPARHEVLITLNLPEDAGELERLWPGPLRRIAHPRPQGFGANHNAAAALGRGRYFAAVDPDLRLLGDPFAQLAGVLEQPCSGIVSTRVLDEAGQPADHARAVPTPLRLLRRYARGGAGLVEQDPAPASDADWIAGLFMAARMDTFRRLGGFDARYHLYCEDVDLCLRAWNAGHWVRVIPAAAVVHAARRQSLKSARHFGWHCRSLARLWSSPAFWRFCLNGRSASR